MSQNNNIQELVPRGKKDLERSIAAVETGYPAVAPILPELLEWLQDYNWPVAHILAPFLGSIGEPMIPHVRHVLDSEDDIWKYWVVINVVGGSREVTEALRDDLERFARSPTASEVAEGLDEAAQDVLDKHGWHSSE